MLEFQIEHHGEVPSTNTLVLNFAREGRPEGLVITADFQTEGRGKPGRTWLSPAGQNLLFSVLLRPPIPVNQAPMLTQIACRSVAGALENISGIKPDFKRPNDLMVGGKKICGILTEALSSPGELEAVVIGVGLNVNSKADELLPTATSLLLETGKTQNRDRLLNAILHQLREDVESLYAAPS